MITRNEVFTRIATKLREKYGKQNIYIVGERVYEPSKFPCVWLVEIDSAPVEAYTDLSLSDSQRRSTFEVQVFSNLSVGATEQASEICDEVGEQFRQIGYLCNMSQPYDNGYDANIKRHVARFTRVLGGGDKLPQ